MTTTVTTTAGTTAATSHGRVAAWLVLLCMGGTSLTYNVVHAAHGHLPWPLAVLFGLAPVAAAMGLSHIVAACPPGWSGWIMRGITVAVMLGAMALSIGATAAVIAPVAPGALRYLFPAVMDAAALVALQVLLAPRPEPVVAPATAAAAQRPRTATTPATPAAGMAAGTATNDAAAPAVAGPAPDGDDAQKTPGQRGEVRRQMRGFWDTEIASGRIPNGAELNRAAGKESDYSLGKRYAAEWRKELPQEMIREWHGESGASALAAVAAR